MDPTQLFARLKSLGGALTVHSVRGEGSTFALRLRQDETLPAEAPIDRRAVVLTTR